MFDQATKLTYEEAMQKLVPVKKVDFKRWHADGEFRLLTAGYYNLQNVVMALLDYKFDWLSRTSMTNHGPDMHKHEKAYMLSNGVQEFVLVVNDMQATEYSSDYFKDTGKHHFIVYLVAGREG